MASCSPRRNKEASFLRVALPRDGITWLPIRLAQTLGYFGEQNINVSFSDSAGKGIEALLGGSVDIATGALSSAIQVATEGREVSVFMILYTRPAVALGVAPAMAGKIKRVVDLRKHNVGIAAPGSPIHQQLNFVLFNNGVAPNEVSVVSIGTGPSSLAALERGKVDAAILVGSAISTFERRNPDALLLQDSRSADGARKMFGSDIFPTSSLMAQSSWLKANSGTARRFAASVLRAMGWMRTHTAEDVRAKMSESERLPDVQADLQAIRQAQRTLSPDGVIPDSAPDQMRKFIAVSSEKVRSADIDLAKVYTNEFVTVK